MQSMVGISENKNIFELNAELGNFKANLPATQFFVTEKALGNIDKLDLKGLNEADAAELSRIKAMKTYKHFGNHITINTLAELEKAKKIIKNYWVQGATEFQHFLRWSMKMSSFISRTYYKNPKIIFMS